MIKFGKNKNLILLLLSISQLILPSLLSAQSGEAGQPGAFLRLGVGARAIGMGRAFTAIADDASAAFWNPAGLSNLFNKEVVGSYAFLSLERTHNYFSFAYPTRKMGTFGISWVSLGISDIEGRDLSGRVTGNFSSSESCYFLSWGYPFKENLFIGCNIKFLSHVLENYNSSGYGFDAGFLYKASDLIHLGLLFQDISTSVHWNTSAQLLEAYPLISRVGVAIYPSALPVKFGFDYERISGRTGSFQAGIEAALMSNMGLRLGYDHGRLSAGTYINVPMSSSIFQTDYSFGRDPIDQTYVHRVSLSVRFPGGESITEHQGRIEPRNMSGTMKMMYPAPEARIIKTVEKYPDYALINAGYLNQLSEGQIYGVYRLEEDTSGAPEKVLTCTVKVVKVKEKISAVKVRWVKEGYSLQVDDVLVKLDELSFEEQELD